MRQKVIIVGAGVAGLTAAHELIERDFEVHVIERRSIAGGKAMSRRVEGDRPTEHGFRFFPGWYRHLPDTMKRIPFRGRRELYEGRSVFDNLIEIDSNLLVWYDREPVAAPMHLPRSFDQLKTMHSFFWDMMKLELAPAEMSFFFMRLAMFLATPEDERRARFQNITWWQYLEADDKSRAFKDLISATTRTMVAAKATEASAYTICRLALRTLFDALSSVDRILNGPTNEKWIDPWVAYLKGRGVHFHNGWELTNLTFAKQGPRLEGVELGSVLLDNLRRLRQLLAPLGSDLRALVALNRSVHGAGTKRHSLRRSFFESERAFSQLLAELANAPGDPSEAGQHLREAIVALSSLRDIAIGVVGLHDNAWLDERSDAGRLDPDPKALDPAQRFHFVETLSQLGLPAGEGRLTSSPLTWNAQLFAKLNELSLVQKVWTGGPQDDGFYLHYAHVRGYVDIIFDDAVMTRLDDALRYLERHFTTAPPVSQADYFVLALPVEQMAYHVNRSMTATLHDPDLAKIVPLADHVDWMAGIQFYLNEKVDLGQGHLVSMDSEWGITAIEQVQFWDDLEKWPAEVKAVISVDISAWDRRGRFVNKEAFNCTDAEIAEEVWKELCQALSNDSGAKRLRDSMLVDGTLKRGVSYHLDDSIVDLCDRRKQGAYERARSARASATAEQPKPFGETVPYMWGPRLRFNVEPLLVNRVGSHPLRPNAKTKIGNLFLASDYVQTETDLACMEGANEAARRAVNALLEVAGSKEKPCELWDFSTPSGLIDHLGSMAKMGNATQLAGEATKVAGKAADAAIDLATRTMGMMRGFWEKR
jgi:uncharacterized protein with NAD-binding domain and iron-sulfur cluster